MAARAWVSMADPALAALEKGVDEATPFCADPSTQIARLRKQRRRALRRALSSEQLLQRVLDVKDSTPLVDLAVLLDDIRGVLRVSLLSSVAD